jgi:adenylate kinase
LARRLRKRALKDNRFDDASETVIQNRFATYEAETKPILEYYSGDRIVEIDASQSPAKVLYDILGHVMRIEAWQQIEKMKA